MVVSVLLVVGGSVAQGAVSDHVHFLEISKGPDYNHPWYPSSKRYEFTLEVVTDTSIVKVEFVTPGGAVYEIPQGETSDYIDELGGYEIITEQEIEAGESSWEWEIKARQEAGVAAFDDGIYQIRCYYSATQYYQTSIPFLIPGTNDPLPQPTQKPEVTYPVHSTMVPFSSDFRMLWELCTDPAVNRIDVDFEDDYRGIDYEYELTVVDTSTPPVELAGGFYDSEISFEHYYFVPDNGDGIPMVILKTSNINQWWSVSSHTTIDMRDVAGLASVWQRDDCDPEVNNNCDGYNLDNYGDVDLTDLAQLLESWLFISDSRIGDHVAEIEIVNGYDYDYPDNSSVSYEFELYVYADDTVDRVEFLTPVGNTFEISESAGGSVPNGWVDTGVEADDERPGVYEWYYEASYWQRSGLELYGDGNYLVTVYYKNGRTDQTTVWFGVPGTSDAIIQPVQEPIFTSFSHGATLASPITFTWQPCTDAAAQAICFDLDSVDEEEVLEAYLPASATGLAGAQYLTSGSWEAELGFEVSYIGQNSDGIAIEVSKFSESDYVFDVE